jgi:hypothetical protein
MESIKSLASSMPGGRSIHGDKAKRVICSHQRKREWYWRGGNQQRCREGIQSGDSVYGKTQKAGKHGSRDEDRYRRYIPRKGD